MWGAQTPPMSRDVSGWIWALPTSEGTEVGAHRSSMTSPHRWSGSCNSAASWEGCATFSDPSRMREPTVPRWRAGWGLKCQLATSRPPLCEGDLAAQPPSQPSLGLGPRGGAQWIFSLREKQMRTQSQHTSSDSQSLALGLWARSPQSTHGAPLTPISLSA